jgi:hypothetical protein
LRSIGEADIEDSIKFIEILTNENQLENFIKGERKTKVWLHTKQNSPEGVFMKFYDMAESLSEFGIKVGVALQSISPKFELCIKVKGSTVNYEHPEKINFVLTILNVAVGKGFRNEKLFISMICELIDIRMPLNKNQMLDINNLIENLKNFKKVIVAQTRLETLSYLRKEDENISCFVPIDAILTSCLAIRHLSTLISSNKLKNIRFIVGNLDIPLMQSTGFLFILKNKRVIAVCLDDLDVFLFKENFDNESDSSISMLSPKYLNYSYHPIRAKFSEQIIKIIELDINENSKIEHYGLESFNENPNIDLINALELTVSALGDDETDVISTLAKFALTEYSELKEPLSEVGFSIIEMKFNFKLLSDEKRRSIKDIIENFINVKHPLINKINSALNFLKEIPHNQREERQFQEEKLNEIISEIKNEIECTDKLKNDIEFLDNHNFILRCSQLKALFENVVIEIMNMKGDIGFHTKMFLSFIIKNNESDLFVLIEKYINRIMINDTILESTKVKFDKQLKSKSINFLAITLSEISLGLKYFILQNGLLSFEQLFLNLLFLFCLQKAKI